MAMVLLFAVSTFNYIDRTILSILQVPIKRELGLSDAQLGLLTGLAFAIFYTTLSIPIARVADRSNRRNLITAALSLWSGMTALCALVTGFASLLFLRIGVAAGEAGSIPASQSIIADIYPPSRRATAMSIWGLSLPVGLLLGYSTTGWLEETIGWRWTFAVVGGLGVALAPLVLLGLKEPMRGARDPSPATSEPQPGFADSARFLWSMPAFRLVVLAAALHGFSQYSMMNWAAPFYVRAHGMSLSSVALYMALTSGIGGGIGIYLGGYFSDRLGKGDPRWRVLVMAISIAAMLPFAVMQYTVPSLTVSLLCGAAVSTLMLCYYGPILAVVHSMVPGSMRAFTAAVLLLTFNIIGLGLGPSATGLASDLLLPHFPAPGASLGYALIIALIPSFAAVILFLLVVYAARLRESLVGAWNAQAAA
jgi:predicted MFS family arabinose efflux permease